MTLNFQEQQAIEILKSLVEISVSGFRTLALLNGGGSLALVSYLGHANPPTELPVPYVVLAVGSYVSGLFFCGLAYYMSHATQLALFNEAIGHLNDPKYSFQPHRKWLIAARIFCILSLLAFLTGSFAAVLGFVGGFTAL